ncbi:DUF305 domain-containing protein [Streptomyces luomodiensis]|uniref:DUF305 domain-containing protein n=1 Tax=Streptomyces luomodiensis TaxID=3026192 RepID=A0ABY9VBL3_9ACTN|nr:DUF305 domain-containing protein [Streptomyces sp. SCA4-21]WNF01618.1 DUF305 domain-containing protein [Streptomyces sp. SCA4-21]
MASRRSLIRRTAALAAATTAAVVLAACGSDSDASSSGHSGHDTGAKLSAGASATASATQGSHNAQDVTFAQEMISHHRQAVTMAGLAPSRAKSQEVKNLASKIKKAQSPEIETMSGWLTAWGEKVPDAGMPGMDHHSGASMPGMMSEADMSKLRKLSGDAFDTAFLQMMISHHRGAIEMAKTEQAKGASGPAKTLAKSIITSQSAEITEMNKMLGKLDT